MVDDQDPSKRVVKRVVKKTVVRPTAATDNQPTVRYGRPVATATKPQNKAQNKAQTKPPAKAKAPARPTGPTPAGTPQLKSRRPQIDLGAKAASTRDVAGRAWWATADTVADGARALADFTSTRARTVAAWRLPHLNAYLAATVTGAVVGLVAVLLGLLSLSIFESVRGVASGGGLWGGVAFIGVAIVSLFLGEALLRGFGVPSPRLTSFLAIILTIVAMLGLFLDVVDGMAALVLVPLLGVAGYTIAHWLADLAENSPTAVE